MRGSVFSVGLLFFFACPVLPQVIINEILKDPQAVPDAKGEWVELYNGCDSTLDLNGWLLRDGGRDSHVIESGGALPILPKDFLVLGRSADSTGNGGYVPDYVYTNFVLSNEEDEVVIVTPGGEVMDSVAYGTGWPGGQGVSMELISPHDDNADPAHWGLAVLPFGQGDLGTPGHWNSISGSGAGSGKDRGASSSAGFSMSPYPNPSGEGFRIRVTCPGQVGWGEYDLEIFDLRGRSVKRISSCCLTAGENLLRWEGLTASGEPAPAGIYFCTLRVSGMRATGKLVVTR
jgi:hypothetical protein